MKKKKYYYGVDDSIRKVSDPYEGALAYINNYSDRVSKSTRNTNGGRGSGYESQPGYIFYDENPPGVESDYVWKPVLIDENYEIFHEWPNFNLGDNRFPIGQPKYGTSVLPNLHLNHASTGEAGNWGGGGAGVARELLEDVMKLDIIEILFSGKE